MKKFLLFASGLATVTAHAAITFDSNNSTWGNNQSFYGSGVGYDVVRTDNSPNSSTAYAMGTTSGSQYIFGFAKELPQAVSSYNLANTDLGSSTNLKLQFSGIYSAPSYVAYTGGLLTSYNYNGASGILTIETSVANIASSASNPINNDNPDIIDMPMTAGFGLIIETNQNFNYGGTVFRTDMFWGDLSNFSGSYPGALPLAGLNANGQNGSNVTFDAYLTTSYLSSIGINSPAECAAYIQKANTSFDLNLARTLYTTNGVDPILAGNYSFGGTSSLNLDGGAIDNIIRAEYANSSWSAGNIGIRAVPEPSSYGLMGAGAFVLAAVARRRKSKKS
jgi:hypothetical protein